MTDKNFKEKTISGLKWNTLNRIVGQVFTLVIGIVLARILSPKEFGILGMVTVLTGFANIFVDFGFTSAIIQNKESGVRHWSSVFWINLIVSVVIAVLFSWLAPFVAEFYGVPELKNLTVVVSWTFFLQSFNLVQLSLLQKELRFKELTIIGLAAQLIAGVIAIWAAYKGYSYWSLVIRQYIVIIVTIIGAWLFSKWLPRFILDRSALKELVQFTLPLVGTKSMNYWTRNADNLMIGKILGEGPLGIYNQAYRLMLLPLQNISSVISGVMFPAYSLIQDDKERVKKIYLQITRAIAFITFPAMFGLCVVAEPFILTLLGEKWKEVIPILQILAPIGATQSLGTLAGNIFLSQGATDQQFKIGLFVKPYTILLMFLGIYLGGLMGIAIGYFIATLTMMPVMYYFMGRLINLSLKEIFFNLARILFASILMALTLLLLDLTITHVWGNLIRLSCLVACGMVIYGGLVLLLKVNIYKTVIHQIRGNKNESIT